MRRWVYEDLVDFKHTKACKVFKCTFHILKTELLVWNDYLSLELLDESSNHVSNSRTSISQGDRSETDVSLQRVSHSHFCPDHSSKRKKKKKNQSTKRPNLRVICFVNLHYTMNCLECLLSSNYVLHVVITCHHSKERTKIIGHLVFVEKLVQQVKWPIIKDATEQKKKKITWQREEENERWKKKQKEGYRNRGVRGVSVFELSPADRRGRNRNLSEVLVRVNFVYENVNHKRKRCATACRQQCTPLLLFERITMDHVDETVLMVSGWDVPRTEPVVQSRRFYAPPYQTFPSIPYLYAISCRNESPHRCDRTTDEQHRSPPFALRFSPSLLFGFLDQPESTPPTISSITVRLV